MNPHFLPFLARHKSDEANYTPPQNPLAIPISLGSHAYAGFEKAVEESYIVEPEVQRNLLDLQVGDLELALCIRDDGLNDNISGGPVAYRFDGGAEVRQRQTHRLGVLAHMMPFLVVL